jgi:signal transduction histidine kinase
MPRSTEATQSDNISDHAAAGSGAGDPGVEGLITDTAEADVVTLLTSWHTAADQLEAAHRARCAEVRQLRQELAGKNAELAERHRLSDFGATVARVAGEMQERIQSVRQHVDLLERRMVNDSSGRSLVGKVVTDLTAWEASLHDLIGLASERMPDADMLSVRELVDGARSALAHQLTRRAVHVVVDVPEDARTRGDQQLLQRAIINVVLQALDRVPDGGEVLVAAANGGKAMEVEVACGDEGSATDGSVAAKPSPDPAAAVLRWAVVHHILHQHGGEALTKADKRGGTSYVLRIPHDSLESSL